MSHKNSMFSVVLKKTGKKLTHESEADSVLYRDFVNKLGEGQRVEVFFDADKDDGTLAQLAKIHKCIRELAKETGHTFTEMKFLVKKASGLCMPVRVEGEVFMDCKSFGDCSKEDLGLALQAIIEIGDTVGVNCR